MVKKMEYIAVIDTETNWNDEVMSIGVVIANQKYKMMDSRYYIISPAYKKVIR